MLKVGAWEMAQTVKCLFCKCEDQCLVPITHIKSQLGVAVQSKASAVEVETSRPSWGSLVRESGLTDEFRASEISWLKRPKRTVPKE